MSIKENASDSVGQKHVEELLSELYYDSKHASAYTSVENVYRAARKVLQTLKRREVEEWFRTQLTPTIHKPTRVSFPRNRVLVFDIDDQWQADLVDMSSKAKYNDGYTFILTCIDCFSKYAWAIPIMSKHGVEIVESLKHIFRTSTRKPKRLQTDKGKEFLNTKVHRFLQENEIQLFTTESDKKASIAERFNRTMKGRTYKYFTANNTYRYVDVLQSLIDGYNNSYHRSIKMKPINVRPEHTIKIRQNLYGKWTKNIRRKEKVKSAKPPSKKYKYAIGDLVRITKARLTFNRGYLPNWSEEIFVVYNRQNFAEPLYYLRDFNGEEIKGGFYEKELQLVHEPEEYRIEKVLRTKRVNGKVLNLVKWKGWSNEFNSWVEN
ncbi:MAG: DDE-type integrase/transposase/recombinase, partial [Planctomycetaceae bacterium]|nr:DDE-type integrase/transposase/recombinase [Planctomycetaceae bacterium]